MNIQIGKPKQGIQNPELYTYAQSEFGKTRQHNSKIEHNKMKPKPNKNELSPITIIVMIIIMLLFGLKK